MSTQGYFDVYAPVTRLENAKPAYRGVIAELGATVRGADDKLSVRPDSAQLVEAVGAWSTRNGAAAVRGELGGGRNNDIEPLVDAPAA